MAFGDHIKVSRAGGLYTHHGIDLGDGTVVHFAGEPLRRVRADVRRDRMEDFLMGGRARIVRYADTALDAERVIETALGFVGTRGYRLWTNNCEHFAAYCKTGIRESRQVRRAQRTAAAASAASFAVAGVVLAARLMARRSGARG